MVCYYLYGNQIKELVRLCKAVVNDGAVFSETERILVGCLIDSPDIEAGKKQACIMVRFHFDNVQIPALKKAAKIYNSFLDFDSCTEIKLLHDSYFVMSGYCDGRL